MAARIEGLGAEEILQPVSAENVPSMLITAENLDFFYGTSQVLHNLNLTFPANKISALIGPSGCGKSTFLRILNRMNDTIEGARATGLVRVGGESILGPEVDVVSLRRRVGMVFQRSNPFPSSVFDNVAYGPRIHGTRRHRDLEQIVERSLRRAELWEEVKDRLRSPALALSGGQQQRLCIARALAVNPEVLLMDEPASALDPRATARIEDLIVELRSQLTLVVVTHNMQQAARVSDLTCFFLEGKVIEIGPTKDLFTCPKEQCTADYLTGRFG